jgi:hypothetical protein
VFSLLIVGVLGGLMAPLGAEAGNPTLWIDGNPVGLTQGGPGCGNDSGFRNGTNSILNSCYSINGTNTTTDTTRSATIRIGNWYVGDYTSGNPARVLINDTTSGTDNMKLTGVTLTSATQSNASTTAHVGHVVLINVFNNAPNGITGGSGVNYSWAMSEGGYYDPLNPNLNPNFLAGEDVINDRFRLFGTGCFATSCSNPSPTSTFFTYSLGPTLNTGFLATSTTNGINGGVSRSNSSSTVKTTAGGSTALLCNTGSGTCAPTLKYDYEITVVGTDALTLTDSVDGCGGLCSPTGATNKLPACVDPVNPPLGLLYQCDVVIGGYTTANLNAIIADGGVISETCTDTCIVIIVDGTPPGSAEDKVFTFTASGASDIPSPFTIKLDQQQSGALGEGVKALSKLTPNPAIVRTFFITGYPAGFELDQVNCSGDFICQVLYDDNNANTKIGWTMTGGGPDDRGTVRLHVH